MIEQHIKAARSIYFWNCPKCHSPTNTQDDDITNGELIIYVKCDKLIDMGEGRHEVCGHEYDVNKVGV